MVTFWHATKKPCVISSHSPLFFENKFLALHFENNLMSSGFFLLIISNLIKPLGHVSFSISSSPVFENNFPKLYLVNNLLNFDFQIISTLLSFIFRIFRFPKIPFLIKIGCHFPSGKPFLQLPHFFKCFK